MTLSLPSLVVSDQACQKNWEVLQIEAAARLLVEQSTVARVAALEPVVATHTSKLAVIGVSRTASSSVVQGPGPVGANVVYTPLTIVIGGGTWLVHAQATVSTSVADGKQISLLNGSTSFEIIGTAGPVEGAAPAGAAALLTTWAAVSFATDTPVQILVKRSGASALTVGFSGPGVSGAQRISAIKINNG